MPYQGKTASKPVEPLKTGELFVSEGLIRPEDIDAALSIQNKRQDSPGVTENRLFGMILCDLNLITPVDNYCILHKHNKLVSLESALVFQKLLSKERVLKARDAALELHIPFISLLLRENLVSKSRMQRLLFDLFHVPFRSIRDFVFNGTDRTKLVSVLDKDLARENRMIPLVLKERTILIGITDPENLLVVQQLNDRFPQYRFKAVFIPFSGFSGVYRIIYETGADTVLPRENPLDLSFLLSFKTSIKDPEQENESVRTLYDRYELLRHLIGNPRQDNRLAEFRTFIAQVHREITREYECRSIEFSLKQNGREVGIIAFPKQQAT